VATVFAVNVIGARMAFDRGLSVSTAVSVRAAGTALFLFLLMRWQGMRLALPPDALRRVPLLGVLVAIQSYCLFSAVALIPVALALLVFQTVPMLYVLLSWATGKESPKASVFLAIPVALAGLALALDIGRQPLAERWADIGAGVTWAISGAIAYTIVFFANTHWVRGVDNRLRTFVMMCVVATLVLAGGLGTGTHAFPTGGLGWLGLAILTVCYGGAMTVLFLVLSRLETAATTVALNFEPIALLGLGWVFLGQALNPIQIVGAFLVVASIVWLGLVKR
jgi:drug/metabolite transporter (DMT)-like permease